VFTGRSGSRFTGQPGAGGSAVMALLLILYRPRRYRLGHGQTRELFKITAWSTLDQLSTRARAFRAGRRDRDARSPGRVLVDHRRQFVPRHHRPRPLASAPSSCR